MMACRERGRPALPLALPLVLLLAACGSKDDRPLQGYIEGEYVRVAAPFAGTLEKLSVQRGDVIRIWRRASVRRGCAKNVLTSLLVLRPIMQLHDQWPGTLRIAITEPTPKIIPSTSLCREAALMTRTGYCPR